MNHTVYAGDFATLDSNVRTGGGTDVTEALQQVLNLANRHKSTGREPIKLSAFVHYISLK